MLGSLNNILVYQAGGRLVLDEPFRAQPTAATITITALDGRELTDLGTGFAAISDVAAEVSSLSLTLPATTLRQRTIEPTATSGFDADIDQLTDPGYVLLVNRGGRLMHVSPAEFATAAADPGPGTDVTSFKLDDGLPVALVAGDTAKGIRVQYTVDWASVTSRFVGQVLATWKVTVDGVQHTIKRIYDVVRQVLHCPATWNDVKNRRNDVDSQTSNIQDKDACVQQAWEDIQEELRQREVYCHLVVPHGSKALRDAVVYRCLYTLVENQSLNVPPQYTGGVDEYLKHFDQQMNRAMGALMLFVDKDEDGVVADDEYKSTRRVWLRGRRAVPPQSNKVSPQ